MTDLGSFTPPSSWPEEAWERRYPPLDLTLPSAQEILSTLPGHRSLKELQSLHLLEGGKRNTNYKLCFRNHSPLVLRIYEADDTGPCRDRTIADLLGKTIPLPQMVYCSSDSTLQGPDEREILSKQTGNRPIALFEFIEGIHPFDLFRRGSPSEIDAFLADLMGHLHRVHEARSYSHHGLLNTDLEYREVFQSTRESFEDYISWALSERSIRRRLGAPLRQELARYAKEKAPLLDEVDDHSLAHGDFKLSNLLIKTTGGAPKVAAILDWEYAFSGSLLFDLAIFLRHKKTLSYPLAAGVERAFSTLDYSLPKNFIAITETLDLMNLLGFLRGSQNRENLYAQVRKLIETTLQDF